MNQPILSRQILDNPAEFEYFFQLTIFGFKKYKQAHMILTDPNDGRVSNYCGKVNIGDKFVESIAKSVDQEFGIKHIYRMEVLKEQDSAKDKHGNTKPRVHAFLYAPIDEIRVGQVMGMDISWSEFTDSDLTMKKEFLNKQEKNDLLESLQNAGATDVMNSEVSYPQMGLASVTIPTDRHSEIMKLLDDYSDESGYEFKYLPNKDSAEVVYFYWYQ